MVYFICSLIKFNFFYKFRCFQLILLKNILNLLTFNGEFII